MTMFSEEFSKFSRRHYCTEPCKFEVVPPVRGTVPRTVAEAENE